MIISPAFAQAANAAPAGIGESIQAFLPLILIFVVFYFLMIRPQQARMKKHKEVLAQLRRGDKVVTAGGIIGTVVKVSSDTEVTVEIADGVKVTVVRGTIQEVVSKTEPVAAKAEDGAKAE